MAPRPSHLPTHFERSGLQAINAGQPVPVGRRTLARMLTKGWIEMVRTDERPRKYSVTKAGLDAIRREIPIQSRSRAGAKPRPGVL